MRARFVPCTVESPFRLPDFLKEHFRGYHLDHRHRLRGWGQGGADCWMVGLSEMVERFTGQNTTIRPDKMEQALDEDTIAELVEKTGLSRSELLARLSQTLPDAVDQATPDGEFPVSLQEPRSI